MKLGFVAALIVSAISAFGVSAAYAASPNKVTIIEKHYFLPSNFPLTNDKGEMDAAFMSLKAERVAQFELTPVEGKEYTFNDGEDRKYIKSYDGDTPVYDTVKLHSELDVTTHFRKNGKLVLKQNFREKILDGHWNGFVKEKHKGHEIDVPFYTDVNEDFKGKVVKGQFYNKVIVEDGTVITFQEIWE